MSAHECFVDLPNVARVENLQEVEIAVNGEQMEGLQMRLGDSGEAYFLEELTASEQMHAHLQQQQLQELCADGQKAQRKISEVAF